MHARSIDPSDSTTECVKHPERHRVSRFALFEQAEKLATARMSVVGGMDELTAWVHASYRALTVLITDCKLQATAWAPLRVRSPRSQTRKSTFHLHGFRNKQTQPVTLEVRAAVTRWGAAGERS